jgi:fumarate reductase subunit D
MKVISIISAVITALLLFSTLVCGLWIHTNKVTDASSITFHMNIGIATVIFSSISVILLLMIALKL